MLNIRIRFNAYFVALFPKSLKDLVLCQIMREIQEHKIKIYEFPETDDEEENRLVKKIKVLNVTSCTKLHVCSGL